MFYKTYCINYEYDFNNQPKTLLLLHGWGGNKDSFIHIKRLFKSQFNILSISMPPYNSSCVPLDMYDYKNIILNILTLLNIKSIYIICHSFGMRVSLMLATSRNVNIEKILITGGAGIILKPNFFKKLTYNFNAIFLRKNPYYFKHIASSDYANLSNVDKITFKNIVNKDLTQYIPLLKCPAYLFWGNRDTATPIKMLKIFKRLHPNTETEIIKNGTHFCYLEYNYKFIEACEKFLT